MKKTVFFLMYFIFFSVTALTFAQILPDKRIIKLEVVAGKELTDSIIIENVSNRDVTIKIYPEDLVFHAPFTSSAKTEYLPLGSNKYSCGKWMTFYPDTILISKKDSQKITYSINVPKDAKGGYWGLIIYENAGSVPTNHAGAGLSVRLACPIFLETTDRIRKVSVKDISVSTDSIKGYFTNQGNVLLRGKCNYYVMNNESVVSDRGDIAGYNIPPGEKAPFTINFGKQIQQGKLTLFINFDLGVGASLIKEIEFLRDKAGNIKNLKIKE